MGRFIYPVDIANRACQHAGAPQIDLTLGFTENSRSSLEIGPNFDKWRRAELQKNNWRFSIREVALRPMDTTTMFLAPSLWSSGTTYYRGSIVSDQAGVLWQSNVPQNIGNIPGSSSQWGLYFGQLSVQPWDTSGTTPYNTGELVYIAPGDGTYKVYLSLISGNSDNPQTATAWSATTTYSKDQIVTFSSVLYASMIDLNTNNEPDLAPTLWAVGTTYAAGNKVCGSDGVIYTSIGNGNVAHNPTTTAGFWTNTGVLCPWTTLNLSGSGSLNWLQLQSPVLTDPSIMYPIGAGPVTQTFSKNVYRLPANFLRRAPDDPKAGNYSFLGAPGNLFVDDWRFEGDYIVTWCSTVLMLRFVADIADVSKMDDLFCEGLAANIGLNVCQPLTQSTAKVQACASEYLKAIGDAKLQNAILVSSVQPPLDDYIACRY